MKNSTRSIFTISLLNLIYGGSGPEAYAAPTRMLPGHTTPRITPAAAVQHVAPNRAMIPDDFELKGTGVQISYSTTSFVGTPRLTYTRGGKRQTFTGAEIRSESSALGQLITVTLDAIPDYKSNTRTIVIPDIHQVGNEVLFGTFAALTTTRSSRGGPEMVKGAVQSYQFIPLQGIAKSVAF